MLVRNGVDVVDFSTLSPVQDEVISTIHPARSSLQLVMDGIRDLVTGRPFTMTGVPTAAILLAATAPVLSATAFTSCKISTPFTAGSPLSIVCVVNTPWVGNDGVYHIMVSNSPGTTPWTANSITLMKDSGNNVSIYTCDGTAATKYKVIAASAASWAADVNHIVITTVSAANAQRIFLDGVEGTTSTGTGGREAAVQDTTSIGTFANNALILNGSILTAIWDRILSTEEIALLSRMGAWLQRTRGV